MKLVKPADFFKNIVKSISKQQLLLGLDVGNKYFGLSVSNTEKIAFAFKVQELARISSLSLLALTFFNFLRYFFINNYM